MPYDDGTKNRFNPENRFVGDIENGLRYPFACYTKSESDERYALKTTTETDIETLEAAIATKAAQSDLTTLSDVVATKAAQADLTTLSGVVDTKAAASDLTALSGVVDTKASQNDLNSLSSTVSGKADISTQTEVINSRTGYHTTYSSLKSRLDVMDHTLTPQEYGAASDGSADCSTVVNQMIASGVTIYFPKGIYKFEHDVEISGCSNVSIIADKSALFKYPVDNSMDGLFKIYNSDNVLIDGIIAQPTSQEWGGNSLYKNAIVNATYAKNVVVKNCKSVDLPNFCCLRNSKNCTVKDNYIVNTTEQRGLSAVFAGSCNGITIDNNTCLGRYADGVISYFGVSKNGRIINNTIDSSYGTTYFEEQGITIDAECYNVIVSHNNIKNCFYGVDVKRLCEQVIVSENIIEACKCGIAVRQGEISEGDGKFILGVNVVSNTIIMNATNMISAFAFGSLYKVVGVFCEQHKSINVNNNIITLSQNSNLASIKVCGVYVHQISSTVIDMRFPETSISNNTIDLFVNNGRALATTAADSTAIFIDSLKSGNICNNRASLTSSGDTHRSFITILGVNDSISIINNKYAFVSIDIDETFFVNLTSSDDTTSTITNSIIKDNQNIIQYPLQMQKGAIDESSIVQDNIGFKNTLTLNRSKYNLEGVFTTSFKCFSYQNVTFSVKKFSQVTEEGTMKPNTSDFNFYIGDSTDPDDISMPNPPGGNSDPDDTSSITVTNTDGVITIVYTAADFAIYENTINIMIKVY